MNSGPVNPVIGVLVVASTSAMFASGMPTIGVPSPCTRSMISIDLPGVGTLPSAVAYCCPSYALETAHRFCVRSASATLTAGLVVLT